MYKKIFSSPLFYPIFLVLICLSIAFLNYTPNTFLSGWDTLHPEFNFSLNFQRLFFGVWRPEQGFGAVSGHSAMADIPRVIILWLFHFIFPLSFLRYSYIFLCLIIGPTGIYYFLKYVLKNNHLSFVGALFYLLNLSTVQQFYVPFEMFPTQWAYLPWIMLFSFKYLTSHHKKDLFLFSLSTLLATPQAYAAHLWYPFFGTYSLFIFWHAYLQKIKIKIPLTLLALTLLINSFWLLPNLYYLATSSWIPKENQQNRLHSQEFLLKNRETGTPSDSTLIKGFYFNWDIYNFDNTQFHKLMPNWLNHTNNVGIKIIGYSLFTISLLGLFLAFVKKEYHIIALSPFFVIPFILLTNNILPFNLLFDFLLQVPLLQEVLRFIFTKISILALFGQTVFFTYLLIHVTLYVKQRYLVLFFSLCLVIYTLPVFSGFLIAPQMRTNIPSDYFQFWEYMKTQPPGKMLALPLFNPDGWIYTSWKYQGSGLIWFGLQQSITDRDSDRWESVNEESYREISTALYSNDPQTVLKYLLKYKLNYIFWDQNVIPTDPKNQDQIAYKYETQQTLNSLILQGFITPVKSFGNLHIFKINSNPSLVQIGKSLPNISPEYHWHNIDLAYPSSDYQTDPSKSTSYYPFRDILTSTNRLNRLKFNPLTSNLPRIILTSADILSANYGAPGLDFDTTNDSLSVHSTYGTHGFSLNLDNLPHQDSYFIGIKSQYLSGLPLRICVRNTYSSRCVPADELSKNKTQNWDYFLVPASDQFSGYQLTIDAISYAGVLSLSQVSSIAIYTLPILPASPPSPNPTKNQSSNTSLNGSLIQVDIDSVTPKSQLIFNQSYNSSWLAFYFQGGIPHFLSNHIRINNWANGWDLPSGYKGTIYIFFWPQLLEFLGFGLLIGTFIYIFKLKK